MKYILIVVLMNGPISIVAEFDNKLACETARISIEYPDAGTTTPQRDIIGALIPTGRHNQTIVSSCNPRS